MADFVAVLKKTLDGLSDTSPQMREKVYEKARLTIASKLGAMNPPPPPAVMERQKRAIEDAIAQVERDYAPKPPASDPLAELEDVFASLKNPSPSREQPRPVRPEPARDVAPKVERPPAQKPAVAEKPAVVEKPVAEKPVPENPAVAEKPTAPARQAPPPPPRQEPAEPPHEALYETAEPERHIPSSEAVEALFSDVPDDDYDHGRATAAPVAAPRRRRRGTLRLLVAAVVVGAVGAGAYGAWINRDLVDNRVQEFLAKIGIGGSGGQVSTPAPTQSAQTDAPGDAAAEAPAPEEDVDIAAAAPEPAQPAIQKFTQRLNADGTETDVGPAGGAPMLGEGTSIASVSDAPLATFDGTTPKPLSSGDNAAAAATTDAEEEVEAAVGINPTPEPATPAESAAPPAPSGDTAAPPEAEAPATPATPATPAEPEAASTQDATPPPAEPTTETAAATPAEETPTPAPTSVQSSAIPVSQRAIFYEERTSAAQASAEPGSTVWSVVQESPGDGLPPEPAIRAETTIPGKEVQLRMTIRRNADKSLPASHIIEMIFLTPDGFEGGGIENVLRVSLKNSEQEAGSPLLGIPAKIADGFFLIALNDTKPEIDANTALLGRQAWIDIPIQYKSGRRALFTMEKGIPGTKVFEEALKAWQAASG